MIETLISSKTRIKLLMKFFLNAHTKAYLRGLEAEFGESSNAIRLELNRLEQADMLCSEVEGNKKYFTANTQHPLFEDIRNLILKHVGLDKVVEQIAARLGHIERVYLSGRMARGLDSDIIDLIFVGEVDMVYLLGLIQKVEGLIKRKIRYVTYQADEWLDVRDQQFDTPPLLLWSKET